MSREFGSYECFIPNPVHFEWHVSEPLLQKMLEEAHFLLGNLNAYSRLVPDVQAFSRMHILKEATLTSRIEGTRTTLDTAFLQAQDLLPEQHDDWQEIQNYISALEEAIKRLDTLPISSRLLREAHARLMQGVRGANKTPGEFRVSQNWIGGATIRDAAFVPPHPSYLPELMSDLENFLNDEEIQVPHLIKIAIAHYQFEAIHPFLDGNGRIGRLLIALYLINNKVLQFPVLYISEFLEKNRAHYYDKLAATSRKDDLDQWLVFFLTAVIETARTAVAALESVLALKKTIDADILPKLGRRAANAQKAVAFLYGQPIVTVQQLTEGLGFTKQTATNVINDLVKLGVLIEKTGFRRNRVFVFEGYLAVFRGRDAGV